MGITNTIASIKDFFKQWHDKEYDELHKDTKNTINSINNRLTWMETQWSAQKGEMIANVINRFNTFQGSSTKTLKGINDDIEALNVTLTTWDPIQTIANGIYIQKLPTLKLAILYVDKIVSYNVNNKYDWIYVGTVAQKPDYGGKGIKIYASSHVPWYTGMTIDSDGRIYYRTNYPKSTSDYHVTGSIIYKYM